VLAEEEDDISLLFVAFPKMAMTTAKNMMVLFFSGVLVCENSNHTRCVSSKRIIMNDDLRCSSLIFREIAG